MSPFVCRCSVFALLTLSPFFSIHSLHLSSLSSIISLSGSHNTRSSANSIAQGVPSSCTQHTCLGLCLCRPLEHLFVWASTRLAPLAPCCRPFPSPQTPYSFPNSLCFSCSIRKKNNCWIVDFPGWNPYCLSLMFTIFLSLFSTSTTLSHNFNVWLKSLINTSEIVTFQWVSFLFIDRCYCACSPLIGNSFSHCLIQHTCHPNRSFISKCLRYLNR